MITQSSVLQEIKRYEKNYQSRKNDPLTLSQLEHKKNVYSNYTNLDQLVKVIALL